MALMNKAYRHRLWACSTDYYRLRQLKVKAVEKLASDLESPLLQN